MENEYRCSRGWGKRCVEATSAKCTCRCGGHNHNGGKGATGVKKEAVIVETKKHDDIETGSVFLRAENRALFINGRVIDPQYSQAYRNHSPDGFNWGYGGSGTAQLALAILFELTPRETAIKLYQQFKWDFLADEKIGGNDHSIDIADIRVWLKNNG